MDAVKLLGSLMGNKSLSSGLGSQLLGSLLGGGGGGGQQPQQQSSGGGQQPQQSSGGGLAELLGGVLGGGGGSQGGANPMAGLLGSLLGGGSGSAGGGIGGLLGSVLGGGQSAPQTQSGVAAAPPQRQAAPQQQDEANQVAVLMIRAMVNAAKSDGRIDQTEQQNIVSKLGSEVSQSEIDFLKAEFAAPLDVASFARSIPAGLERQVYGLSLTSIELDTQNEAQYLGQLAQGLKMDPQVCNQIHERLGAPKIFG